MYKKVILSIGLFLLHISLSFAKVSVNEISTSNYSSFMNKESYDFSNYIEFDTEGDSVNLNGYLIIHYGKQAIKGKHTEKWRWVVNKDFVIGPYSVLWLDESAIAGHAPYKLDADGGYIMIFNEGEAVDSFYYNAMEVNMSYGRTDKGCGYMVPTPGIRNSRHFNDLGNCRCPAPQFSQNGGVYAEPFEMVIEGEGDIYYTTDGSEPSMENGKLYNGTLYIDRNSNIRAKAFKDTLMPSTTVTASYFVGDEKHSASGFTLPIVSITVDSAFFYDDTIGICVKGKNGAFGEKSCVQAKANYNQEWKRPVNFEYIVDGQSVVNQDLEAKVEGGCSRSSAIKSLSLKASNKTGKDSINYHFFQSKPNIIHSNLHLRNGGTAYSKVRFRDGLMQTFAIGMNIDYQAFQPVAYYINGVYQGLMDLNERTNADYIEANYGIDEDDIDLVTLSDQLNIRASKGTVDAYLDLTRTLESTTEEENDSVLLYERALGRMDMDEYVDYQIFQQFIVNTDWPGNNTKLWRETDGGKFRWILFDTDFGFGLPGYEYLGGSTKNMINWCAGVGTQQWANEEDWMTDIFRNLYKNRFFMKKFMTKYLIHLSTTFTKERIVSVFDSITALVDNEYKLSFNGQSAITATSSMRNFALARPKNIYNQLKKYVGGGDTVSLRITSDRDDATIYFNGEPIKEYNGKYFLKYELELNAIPPKGYELDHWVITCDTIGDTPADTIDPRKKTPGYLVTKLRSGGMITAKFRIATSTDTSSKPTLLINEICSSSNALSKNPDPTGKYGDWIEIYNYGNESCDLAGLSISIQNTGNSSVKQSIIPTGFEQTIIRPKEHKVLWAKGDTIYGPSSLNFSIDKDSLSTICITRNGTDIIDCVELVPLQTNESYARETDGAENWVVYTADPLELNPTPGKKNGEKDTTGVQDNLAEEESILLYPNPTENEFTILSSDNMEQIVIYDMTGRVIFREEVIGSTERTIDTSSWDKGLYIVKAITKGQIKIAELIKGGS